MRSWNAPLANAGSVSPFQGDKMSEPERLRESDQDRAGYCRHNKRILKQGTSKTTGKVWRGEFCRAGVCEPEWWRWNDTMGIWVSPMHEPNDYLYVGWNERREETNDGE